MSDDLILFPAEFDATQTPFVLHSVMARDNQIVSASLRGWFSLCVAALAVFMMRTDSGLLSIDLSILIGEFIAGLALGGWIAP